ncbi:hypothetical protein HA466_0205130 [Hirschfeldia incana]|nr:hypothetical protein HA466_0205130 [Hirschfeldia incana]KAJ0242553.1 hypothetical protein HA466_0205130 [Hirschfeldia incana]
MCMEENSNNGFSTKKKLGYKNNSGYYGGYYPQAHQYYPIYGYDMMKYASGKTTNTTLQYPYLGRSDSSMYSMYGPYMTGYGYYNTYTPKDRSKGFKIGQPETIKATEGVSLLLLDPKEYNKKDFFYNTYTNAKLL